MTASCTTSVPTVTPRAIADAQYSLQNFSTSRPSAVRLSMDDDGVSDVSLGFCESSN